MLTPDRLKTAYQKIEEENWSFRSFLKEQSPGKVDRLFRNFHNQYFKDFDCIACSNCCKHLSPIVDENEIRTISGRLDMTEAVFIDKYLAHTDDGYVLNSKPCPFLAEHGCRIYDCRPLNCREYPHSDKADIVTRLCNLVENCEVCPVLYEIFERMKKYYREEFEEYKAENKEYESY